MKTAHPRSVQIAKFVAMVSVVMMVCALPVMAQNTFPSSGNVGVGYLGPFYPVHVNYAMAVSAGPVNTGGEGNFNTAFAAGNTFLGQTSGTGAAVIGNGSSGKDIIFTTLAGATFVEMVRITSGGNVGIGTSNPGAKLDINGSINVSGNIAAKYQDIAEWVASDGNLPDGDVVVLSEDHPNVVEESHISYDTKVAGVVSAKPGMILGEASAEKSKIATTGRVKVKVDATKHPVKMGDLLVTSDTPGYAMVSEPVKVGGISIHRPGTIIGKALEPLASGRGEILVLLSLQ